MTGSRAASDFKFFSGYSNYIEELLRKETWLESTKRVMDMHRTKYEAKMTPELSKLIDYASKMYEDRIVLASQRSLQFGGEPLLKKNARMFNCLSSYADRLSFFQETMYFLLCGCGVGFSVQHHHIEKLPNIKKRDKGAKTFQIPDSIEGWSDAFGVLISSYVTRGATFSEYKGHRVDFDFSLIRPQGSMISGGFKAPGPDGLREALRKVARLLDDHIGESEKGVPLNSITIYDFVMHMSDAVLSGGVRRSATICLFSKDDEDMLNAKMGNWRDEQPQRARSNNSAVLIKDELTREEFHNIMQSTQEFGEPGFIFSSSTEIAYNPCVEIGMYPQNEKGVSGFQGCNLTEINGGACTTEEIFYAACKASAIIGTLQAGYTDIGYVDKVTREIFEREALLGCSITGWMNNPEILFNPEILRKGAGIVKQWNKVVAELIGINQAARCTTSKPSGNASVLLECASGIGGEHSKRFFRNAQVNKEDDCAKLYAEFNPEAVEESVWSANNTDYVISFPIETTSGSLYKSDLLGVKQLEYVKLAQQNWIEYGTNVDLCVYPETRHNISNTITVDDWDEVEEYIYENRHSFAGISLIPITGDKDYAQAPFTEVLDSQELLEKYGDASILASGLVVDGLHAFGDLWEACSSVLDASKSLPTESNANLLSRDWVRRVKQFAERYMEDDLLETTYCLKDVYNFHKWLKITRDRVTVPWETLDLKPQYTDINTTGAIACAGGTCDLPM